MELKYIVDNGIEIETEIYLITDTTLCQRQNLITNYIFMIPINIFMTSIHSWSLISQFDRMKYILNIKTESARIRSSYRPKV